MHKDVCMFTHRQTDTTSIHPHTHLHTYVHLCVHIGMMQCSPTAHTHAHPHTSHTCAHLHSEHMHVSTVHTCMHLHSTHTRTNTVHTHAPTQYICTRMVHTRIHAHRVHTCACLHSTRICAHAYLSLALLWFPGLALPPSLSPPLPGPCLAGSVQRPCAHTLWQGFWGCSEPLLSQGCISLRLHHPLVMREQEPFPPQLERCQAGLWEVAPPEQPPTITVLATLDGGSVGLPLQTMQPCHPALALGVTSADCLGLASLEGREHVRWDHTPAPLPWASALPGLGLPEGVIGPAYRLHPPLQAQGTQLPLSLAPLGSGTGPPC